MRDATPDFAHAAFGLLACICPLYAAGCVCPEKQVAAYFLKKL